MSDVSEIKAFIVTGRLSDRENYTKLVWAANQGEAEAKLEAWVRTFDDEDNERVGCDFHTEHCKEYEEMVAFSI